MNAPGRDPDALARIAVRLRSSLQRKVEREIGTVRRVAEGRIVASLQDGFLGEVLQHLRPGQPALDPGASGGC